MLAPKFMSLSVVGLFLFCLPVSNAEGDIYRYRDHNGVWHYTNIKKDTRYKLFIRTPRRNVSQYIKEYEGTIAQAATRFGVEAPLIKAVIKAESDFDSLAESIKGAKGLMQLMPETARAMAVKDPLDPVENIFGGTRYLSLLLKRFNGDKSLAVAAYNAGPEKVEASGGIPPINETRAFVERVLDYYKQFRKGSR